MTKDDTIKKKIEVLEIENAQLSASVYVLEAENKRLQGIVDTVISALPEDTLQLQLIKAWMQNKTIKDVIIGLLPEDKRGDNVMFVPPLQYTLKLTRVRPDSKKIEVLKCLRELVGWELSAAKNFVDRVDSGEEVILYIGHDREQAVKWGKKLSNVGCFTSLTCK